MRVVVTGGAGFIGSRLVRALAERGDEVIVLDDLSTGDAAKLPSSAELLRIRTDDPETALLIARLRPRIVFHLAAQVGMASSLKDPSRDGRSNVLGTIRVLEGCKEAGSKLVFSSTSGVYGEANGGRPIRETAPIRPSSPYGLSKWSAEQYIRHAEKWWGIPYAILRYANVYGPGQTARGEGGVVACFLERLAAGLPLIVHGDGEQRRDFVHVDDVVEANLAAIERGEGGTYNVGTGIATSINQLAGLCERLSGSALGRVYEPGRTGDARCSRLSPREAGRALGWKPSTTLRRGIAGLFGTEDRK